MKATARNQQIHRNETAERLEEREREREREAKGKQQYIVNEVMIPINLSSKERLLNMYLLNSMYTCRKHLGYGCCP